MKAREFAEAMAPVIDLIASGLEVLGALPKYVSRLSWQEIVKSLEVVAWAIDVMAGYIAIWGTRIEDDMQAAAQGFAEAIGPVVDLIGAGLEVLGSAAEIREPSFLAGDRQGSGGRGVGYRCDGWAGCHVGIAYPEDMAGGG